MKKMIALLLCLILVTGLCPLALAGEDARGLYSGSCTVESAKSTSVYDIELELKADGGFDFASTLDLGDICLDYRASGVYTLTGESIALTADGFEGKGTVKDGRISLSSRLSAQSDALKEYTLEKTVSADAAAEALAAAEEAERIAAEAEAAAAAARGAADAAAKVAAETLAAAEEAERIAAEARAAAGEARSFADEQAALAAAQEAAKAEEAAKTAEDAAKAEEAARAAEDAAKAEEAARAAEEAAKAADPAGEYFAIRDLSIVSITVTDGFGGPSKTSDMPVSGMVFHTVLSLNGDGTYAFTAECDDKEQPYSEKGTYTVEGSTVTLNSDKGGSVKGKLENQVLTVRMRVHNVLPTVTELTCYSSRICGEFTAAAEDGSCASVLTLNADGTYRLAVTANGAESYAEEGTFATAPSDAVCALILTGADGARITGNVADGILLTHAVNGNGDTLDLKYVK